MIEVSCDESTAEAGSQLATVPVSCGNSAVQAMHTTYGNRQEVDTQGSMSNISTMQLLIATFAGWVHRHQVYAVEYEGLQLGDLLTVYVDGKDARIIFGLK